MIKKFLILLLITFVFAPFGNAQVIVDNGLSCEINRTYPSLSISRQQSVEAKTLLDLNKYYKPSWVKEYMSVEINTIHNGKIKKAKSPNDTLTEVQKENLLMADVGEDISVKVRYLPDNALVENDVKEFNFHFIIDPETEAHCAGGALQMKEYLIENVINKIPAGSLKQIDLAIVQFTIDEGGHVGNVQPYKSAYYTYQDETIHNILMQAICNMPKWVPAEYSNGTRVKQDFVIRVGNMENCVTNLLNIH